MAEFWIKNEDYASLKDQSIVLTGGSSGIGEATVQILLDAGAKVTMGDQHIATIKHENLTFVKTDVTSWSQLKVLFKTAVEQNGRVDHVFANAGIGPKVNYLEDNYDESGDLKEPGSLVYDVNLKAMINTAYLGIHYMQKQEPKGGSIVCTASASSYQRFPAWDYTTTKHGILGWMRAAVPNFQETKIPIRVNVVGPSWTLTGMVPKEIMDAAGLETQTPDVVGRQVAVLMADEKRTGQFIYSSGGRHYEIEENFFLPTAMEINRLGQASGPEKLEQLGFTRLKEAVAEQIEVTTAKAKSAEAEALSK